MSYTSPRAPVAAQWHFCIGYRSRARETCAARAHRGSWLSPLISIIHSSLLVYTYTLCEFHGRAHT
eukprot:scaffold4498_cov119-Isochrysis_galbana.AAC.36